MNIKKGKTALGKHPKLFFSLILLIFLITAALTIYYSNSYLATPLKIAECNWEPPGENFIMAECTNVITPYYRRGSLYLNVDSRLTQALRSADVVITGNSRTIETFVYKLKDNPIEEFFKRKNLKLFFIAEEGSGFRYRKMVLERLNIHPKIALINTEDMAADLFDDYNKEIILSPDRFKLPFKIIHFSIELQHSICSSKKDNFIINKLKNFYCHGTAPATWRSLETGGVASLWAREPTKREKITMQPDLRISSLDVFRRRMNNMLKGNSWSKSCIIFYEVPNPSQYFEVSTTLAKEAKKPFIFPEVSENKNYFVYDGSHMEIDTAIRWTKEFIAELEPSLDTCINELKEKANS